MRLKRKAPVEEDPNCEKTRNYARYYDTPDGCDVMTKVKVASRYGVVAGLIMGTYDVLMFSHVVGMGPMLKRYARHVVPLGLMGATFALVSNLVLRARNIDDKLNYFLGGFACGPLVALHLRSGHGLVAGGIVLGLVGVIKKEAVEQGYEFMQKVPGHMNLITSCRHDYTLATDPRDEILESCDDDKDDKQKPTGKRKRKKQEPGTC